jgi:hypothetical protein
MSSIVHHLRIVAGTGEQPSRWSTGEREPLDLLTLVILVLGLVPFAGLAWWRAWDSSELGLATLMVLFAGRELLRHVRSRVRSAAHRPS